MDLKGLFNVDGNEEQATGGVKSAMSNEEKKAMIDKGEELFNQQYGGFDEFLTKHLDSIVEPYHEATSKALNKTVQAEGDTSQHAVAIAYGTLLTTKELIQSTMMNSLPHGQLSMMKAAVSSKMINDILPSDNPEDDLITVLACIATASYRLAELIAHVEIERLDGVKGE